jgi:RNA polymerase sigma-70 factor (sigma-E family)
LTRSPTAKEQAFARFAQHEFESLVTTLSTITGLPNDESRELVQLAFIEASTRWKDPAVSSNAREWVLGCAIWLYRRGQSDPQRHRDLPSTMSAVHESISSALPKSEESPSAGVRVTGALALAATAAPTTVEAAPRVAADKADQAVTALYTANYRSLVQLAALLVRDVAAAEDIARDSFVSLHGQEVLLEDDRKALSYLRQSVVNRSRSFLRQTKVDRDAPKSSAEHGAITQLQRSAVLSALRKLPPRQREALVLRYYMDLSEAQIASAMGISRDAVKSHTARGMSALRSVLEREA